MSTKGDKPQGASGKMAIGAGSPTWHVIEFPGPKAEREQLIAQLFIEGFDGYVAMQSEPSLAPFGPPVQNPENDLDFTVPTALGNKLMELAEFAPLNEHGPKFTDAPLTLDPKDKAPLALGLISDKSAHQGGADRFLVLYTTEQAFWLDPITIERMRRVLASNSPQFDRVYYAKPHDLHAASVSEIYPGRPHHVFGDRSDEQLDKINVSIPHPTEMIVGRTWEWTQTIGVNGKPIRASFRANISGIEKMRRNDGPSGPPCA